MHDGTLNHALKAQRGLGINLFIAGQRRVVFLDEVGQARAQLFDLRRAGLEHFGGRGVVEQGEQQVLGRDELVALLACLDKGHVQGHFQFLGNHVCLSFPCPRLWGRKQAAKNAVRTPHRNAGGQKPILPKNVGA